jgi:hypothetical protein
LDGGYVMKKVVKIAIGVSSAVLFWLTLFAAGWFALVVF